MWHGPREVLLLTLRKVELIGFKSFCERTTITFSGNGTTCIVGPNGCGKSNVVDAICWALGEQSHKSLRGERMSDCIFNGPAKRPPMGLSEVMITLEDPELADAARFIIEGAAKSEENAGDASAVPGTDVASVNQSEGIAEAASDAPPAGDAAGAESLESTTGIRPGRRKRAAEKAVVQTKPGEVVVGRRLYRSGQSEYLINGRTARLRDIQDLFMGMGLGPDSYAIIEQGRIGQILSTKPMERRAIIEEAAGVTKFKSKKRLAEAKLESSKINLSRVNDIVVEVEKQLGLLKRQASKARRYAEIREQMRGIIRQVLASKARELDSEAERLAHLLGEFAAREAQQTEAIRAQELEQEQLSQKTYSLDAELRQNQNLFSQAALELDRAENRIVFNQHRALELESRRKQLDAELEQTLQHPAQPAVRRAAHMETSAPLSQKSRHLEASIIAPADNKQDLVRRAQQTELSVEDLRQKAGQYAEDLIHLHGEQRQSEEALAHYAEAQSRLQTEEHQLLEES